MIANGKFIKYDPEEKGDDQILERKISTDMIFNQRQIQFEEHYVDVSDGINQRAYYEHLQGSGFNFQNIIEISIHIYLISHIRGKSYVKLPFSHHSLLNIKNIDNFCFIWSILAHLHPIDSKNKSSRVWKYETFIKELNVSDIDLESGMKIKGIHIFEKQIEQLSIKVFEFSN